jgi:hypothetical protein
LSIGEEQRESISVIETFVKSNKKPPELQQLLKNYATLTEWNHYAGSAYYLLSGVILGKLLK